MFQQKSSNWTKFIKKSHLNDQNTLESIKCKENLTLKARKTIKGSQNFEAFDPLIATFLKLGEEIIVLYEKAKHNKELCSFLLKRYIFAIAAVKNLDMRRTEDPEFFSKKGNVELFEEFIKCMKRIKEFIQRVGKLHKLIKYMMAHTIEKDLEGLIKEFDAYLISFNFSFTTQSRDDSKKIKDYVIQIYELLFDVYKISDKPSQQNFLNRMNLMIEKTNEYQK